MLKKYFWLAFAFLLGVAACLPYGQAEAARARQDYATVLMYHDIKAFPLNSFDVTEKDFQKQLDWLQENHYRTLSMDEYIDILESGRPFPEKSILITFDDGYEGVYTRAMPALIRHNMKATFFIVKKGFHLKLVGYPCLSRREVEEMAQNPLFTIGSHTLTHPDLTKLSAEELQKELQESKACVEKITGKACRALAYPYGFSNPTVWAATQAAGYQAAFSIACVDPQGADTRYTIPRIYMGMALGKNDNALFKKYIQEYARMPAEMFAEQFGPVQY